MDERDVEILRLAGAHYRYEARRQASARERFDLGPTAFWARVVRTIGDPEIEAAEPVLVHRLQRLMDVGRAKRTAIR